MIVREQKRINRELKILGAWRKMEIIFQYHLLAKPCLGFRRCCFGLGKCLKSLFDPKLIISN